MPSHPSKLLKFNCAVLPLGVMLPGIATTRGIVGVTKDTVNIDIPHHFTNSHHRERLVVKPLLQNITISPCWRQK